MAAIKDSFQGRLVLITGGSSGLGLALANLLAAQGANVWLIARRKDVLENAFKALPTTSGQHHGKIAADVSDWAQVQTAVASVIREAGIPDLLINCAGYAHPGYVQVSEPRARASYRGRAGGVTGGVAGPIALSG